jgi:hypothetical protein
LSDQDKLLRYLDQQRREKYAKRKSEEEKRMVRLTKQDSDDLNIMFTQLDDGMKETHELSEYSDSDDTFNDEAFFWSMQREGIQSGNTRWHPRLVKRKLI